MSAAKHLAHHPAVRRFAAVAAVGLAGIVGLSACGDSSGTTTTASGSGSTGAPGTTFSTAKVAGLGTVVVDGRGHTVYVLTASGQKNVPCDDPSGCTKVWPDLALPGGTAPTAGSGVQASLLSTMKLASGETYPTYNGWLMYEYVGDTGKAQGTGQGITSFGGTWYAITPSGDPVTATGTPTTAKSSTGAGGAYGY